MYGGGGSSVSPGGMPEAERLRRQLEDMQRSFEEANAARDTAFEELKATKRQVELGEAARQLHDAEARSQAVRAVTEMQKMAERRVTQAEEDAERQIMDAESRAAEQVRSVQEDAENRLADVQRQTEGIADATRKLHDAEARRQALRAVSEVQKMADLRLRSEKARMDEMIAAAHEASSLQIKGERDKAELAIQTVQQHAEELAAARVSVAEAEQAARAKRTLAETKEASEQRMEEMRRQFDQTKAEVEIQTEQKLATTIVEAEAKAAQSRKDVEERARAEAERAIADAHAAAAAERQTMLQQVNETQSRAQEMMRLSEQAVAVERESREAAEMRIQDEAEARLRAEQYASQAARQVQVAQIRLKAASEGALMARRALVSAQDDALSRTASPESLAPGDTAGVGAAVQAYVDATANHAPETADVPDLQLGDWTLRKRTGGELIWTGVRPDDLPESGATEHRGRPSSVPDTLLWVANLTSLTDGMHAPLVAWLQQLFKTETEPQASPSPENGADAESFALLQQRCQFIEHWAKTIAQHGPEMEQLIKAKNAGNPAFAFLADSSSMEGQYYIECMARFRPGNPAGARPTEAENVLQLIAEHEAALRSLQLDAQNGQLTPAAVAKIEQVTSDISKLTTHLDRLETSEAAEAQRKQRARRSTSTSRPKSAKRSTSRGRQRTEYGHGQSHNRHARPSQPSTPRGGAGGKPRPKTPSSSRNGATTPGRQGAQTPNRQGARTPGRQGARTPGRQGAVTPGRQAPASSRSGGTTPKRRPGSAPRRAERGPTSPRAAPVRVQHCAKPAVGHAPAATSEADAMRLLDAEAKAWSQPKTSPASDTISKPPAPKPEEEAPAPSQSLTPAKRAQSNPRSLFARRKMQAAAAKPEAAGSATPPPVQVAAPEPQAVSAEPPVQSDTDSELRLITASPSSGGAPRTTSEMSGISLPHSSPKPPSGDPQLDRITSKLRALSYGAAGQDPARLFRHYDRDNSGELELPEFTTAIRKGAELTTEDISDSDVAKLFSTTDIDGDGAVSIDELTQFVWGYSSPRGGGLDPMAAEKKARDKETRRLLAKQRGIPEKIKSLKLKLAALSYGSTGQDPAKLFKHYDRDNSGSLDMAEFTQAVRKGGHLSKHDILDGELRSLFRTIDDDNSGEISIDEMTEFVWGTSPDDASHPDHEDHDAELMVTIEDICETIVKHVRRTSIRITDIFHQVQDEQRRAGVNVDSAGGMNMEGLNFAILKMGIELQPDELVKLFEAIDYNGDETVDSHEFIQFIRRRGRSDGGSPRSPRGGGGRAGRSKKASVARLQHLSGEGQQQREENLREKRMMKKKAEEEALAEASIPWHERQEYKKSRKSVKVADGVGMKERFQQWEERKKDKVEQKRGELEEKKKVNRTPQLSKESKRLMKGRPSGDLVTNLHQWNDDKKAKMVKKRDEQEKAEMDSITLTPKMEKSFSSRKEHRYMESDVLGHTHAYERMHPRVARDANESPHSKVNTSQRVRDDRSVASGVGPSSPPGDYDEGEGGELEQEEAMPVPELAQTEEFDSRADKLAAKMAEAQSMLATGFDPGEEPDMEAEADRSQRLDAAFGLRGEGNASGSGERVVLGGHVLVLPEKVERHALFDRIDNNGSGTLSLAEIDKAVVTMWPQFDHKKALMRAYRAADRDDDGFIRRREFAKLLKYIVYFNELWDRFEDIDANHDHRLNLEEFIDGCAAVGLEVQDSDVAFQELDADGGGFILFDEFCYWCAAWHVGEELDDDPEEPMAGDDYTPPAPEAPAADEPAAVPPPQPEPEPEPQQPADQATLEAMQAEAEAQKAKFKAEQKALGLDNSSDEEEEPTAAEEEEEPAANRAAEFDDRAGRLAAEMAEAEEMLAAATAEEDDEPPAAAAAPVPHAPAAAVVAPIDTDFAQMQAIMDAGSSGPSAVQADLEALLSGGDLGSPVGGVALTSATGDSLEEALSRIPVAGTPAAVEVRRPFALSLSSPYAEPSAEHEARR